MTGPGAGIKLDEVGRGQAARAGGRLGVVPLVGVVSSPLERCRQTSRGILDHQTRSPATPIERGITECDYGEWQGRERHDAAFEVEHGPGAVWVAVSHGDIIKSILADALGMHLDLFQRISVNPGSAWSTMTTPARPPLRQPGRKRPLIGLGNV